MSAFFQKLYIVFVKFHKHDFSFLFYLLSVMMLAYGVLIPLLGFYWDDLPFLWFMRFFNDLDLITLEAHRPFTGIFFFILRPILQFSPLRWQIFNLLNRFILGIAGWYLLRGIFTTRKNLVDWITLLFVLYPGFDHQFISVNSSRHIFSFSLLLLSLRLSIKTLENPRRMIWIQLCAVILSSISMLMSDYFYMLEIFRPVILLMLISPKINPRMYLNRIFRLWAPTLLSFLLIGYWRIFGIGQPYYQIVVSNADHGFELTRVIKTILADIQEVASLAWFEAFTTPKIEEIGSTSIWFYILVVILVFILSSVYFIIRGKEGSHPSITSKLPSFGGIKVALLGLLLLVLGGVPSWAVGLPIRVSGIQSRLSLPMSLGASLLVGGVFDLIKSRRLRIAFLASVVAFSAGSQFHTAVGFRWDWQRQRTFFWQMVWRIPDLEKYSVIASHEFPFVYETDNSMTAIVNWLYSPEVTSERIDYMVYDIKTRLGGRIPKLEPHLEISHVYREFGNGRQVKFEGSTSNMLVIYHKYPACLRVIQPVYDGHMTGFSPYINQALDLSNPELVKFESVEIEPILEKLYGPEPEGSWCYFYQKADLARQKGEWQLVYDMGEAALSLGSNPSHVSEYAIYIEAFGRKGDFTTAKDLTALAIQRDPGLDRLLCDVWRRIEIASSLSKPEQSIINDVVSNDNCLAYPD